MLFNSLEFLFGFLPITYLIFWRLKSKESRYVWLTITGYVFYAFWNYKFCAVMAFSTLVSYLAGRGLLAWPEIRRRRICLIVPITVDLLLLGFFKYANFTIATYDSLAQWLHIPLQLHALDIVLPIGISFYTFHTITYIVDSYRGTIKPTRNLFEFSAYVSLFSQLVAGPIVRFRQIEGDLENIDLASRAAGRNIGWSYFVVGMIKKVLIADTIAAMINPLFYSGVKCSTGLAWLMVLGYTFQLYFDFSGYSDMAVGLGHLFGLRLPQNFNSPYKAVNIADFWHRWHISLSTCLRDYLYIPLGGSRGSRWQLYRNVMITMLLGGLWHGANWTFVVWGAYHGLLLVGYRLVGAGFDRWPVVVRRAVTFLLVVIGWVFFRAPNLGVALALLQGMFWWTTAVNVPWSYSLLGVVVLAGVITQFGRNTTEMRHDWGPWSSLGLAGLFGVCVLVIFASQYSPFLYFQF
jgi:alginate O-acetyltransferase complex protein AlgI